MTPSVDDPLFFDPWGAPEEPEPAEPRTPRWRSPAGSQGVPLSRRPPSPIEEEPPADPAPEAVEEELPGDVVPEPIDRLAPDVLPVASITAFAPAPPTETRPRRDQPAFAARQPPTDPTSTAVDIVRAVAIPRCEALSRRLVSARHETALDDRLDQRPASLRFRLRPWKAPFDDPARRGAGALELTVDPDHAESVVGRIWLDPDAPGPTELRSVALSGFDAAWVDRLLVELVERILGRG